MNKVTVLKLLKGKVAKKIFEQFIIHAGLCFRDMNIKSITNTITKPNVLAPAAFLSIGTGKVYYDYKKEQPTSKKRVLIKDSAIIAGSILGFLLVNPLTKFICKNYTIQNKVMKASEYILAQAFAGTINTFAAIAGAIYSNELVHKYFLDNPKYPNLNTKNVSADKSAGIIQQSSVFKNFNYVNTQFASTTANAMLSTALYVPAMKVFNTPIMALSGFSVANTKGYHNKLKKTTYELLANTMIPSLIISGVSLFVDKKKPVVKYPALFASICAGSYAGVNVANQFKQQLDEKIDGLNLNYLKIK